MSNSSLVSYVDTSTSNWNDRKYPITRITIHHAAGKCTMGGFSSILRSGREVSWNYAIDNDGRIGLFVHENHRAWTSSSPDNDHRAITIEVSNSQTGGNWPVSPAAYNSLLNLCEDICRRNGISRLTYTGSLSGSNLTMHRWFSNTNCPGPYLESKFPSIASEVNRRLGYSGASPSLSTTRSASTPTSYSAATQGYIDTSQINEDALNPYIITLDRNSPSVDYQRLQGIGVLGSMIEAGYLYNSIHKEVTFKSPKLESQVEACISSNIPYAFYFDAKARSVAEAKKEMYQLSFIVRVYPPALGVWAHLCLPGSTNTNNSIINEYTEELTRLGLKGKIGFYVTRSELKQITWSKYQDDWYLWLVDRVSSLEDFDGLLTPQFFLYNTEV